MEPGKQCRFFSWRRTGHHADAGAEGDIDSYMGKATRKK